MKEDLELRGWQAGLVIAALVAFVIGAALALRYFLISQGAAALVADLSAILSPFAVVAVVVFFEWITRPLGEADEDEGE